MKQDTIKALREIQRELGRTDGIIFDTECTGCDMPCDLCCGKTCKAYYAMDVINHARASIIDLLVAVAHEQR